MISCYFYFEKNSEYEIDILSRLDAISSEQSVMTKVYFPMGDEQLSDSLTYGVTEKDLLNIENQILSSVYSIKKIEYQEEYFTNNRLASRNIDSDVGSADETIEEKYFRIFGADWEEMRGRVQYYENEEEALENMKWFKVDVWALDENNDWYIRTVNMCAHKNIVKTIECIYTDLLTLPEEDRVPIKTIGCYNYRAGSSAHTCGTAIDMNWVENAEMTNSGRVTAGHHWKPGEDIYSIKPDSPFVKTFEKYGFTWGGYWESKKDYMHFSYIDR
jgi:hypothetical protein